MLWKINSRENSKDLYRCLYVRTIMHLSMSSRQGGDRRGIGRDFDRSLWPRGRAFEFSCCPGGRDIWIFVRARDHKSLLGVGNLVTFDLTFLPVGREFDSNLLENVKIPADCGSLELEFWKLQELLCGRMFEPQELLCGSCGDTLKGGRQGTCKWKRKVKRKTHLSLG